jgi:predicted XRE-type DNA-binding protein
VKPQDIKAKIVQAGTTQAAIAAYLGVSAGCMSQVISGKVRSKRIEAELSKVCGQPVNPKPLGKSGRAKTVWTGKVGQVAV